MTFNKIASFLEYAQRINTLCYRASYYVQRTHKLCDTIQINYLLFTPQRFNCSQNLAAMMKTGALDMRCFEAHSFQYSIVILTHFAFIHLQYFSHINIRIILKYFYIPEIDQLPIKTVISTPECLFTDLDLSK